MELLPLVSANTAACQRHFPIKSRSKCCVAALLSVNMLAACGSSSSGTTIPGPSVGDTDTIGPVITLNAGTDGNATVALGQGRDYHELDASAFDAGDDESTAVSIDTSALNLSETGTADELGSFEVIYSSEDSLGNVTEVTRTVNVIERRPFITTWDTAGTLEIDIPLSDVFTDEYPTLAEKYNFQIDCGEDAVVKDWQMVNGAELTNSQFTCEYYTSGIKTIQISDNLTEGKFAQIYLFSDADDALKLLTIEQWGDVRFFDMYASFFGGENLVVQAQDIPDLRLVPSLKTTFARIAGITSDINGWDVSGINDFSFSFIEIESFNQNISGWDVSSGTIFTAMFLDAVSFNQDISGWDVSNATSLLAMFTRASSFDQNLASWQVPHVTNMAYMLNESGLSTTNYDATLIGWSAQEVLSNVKLGATTLVRSSASDEAVAILEVEKNWNVDDATPE